MNTLLSTPHCNCGNHTVAQAGETCEICMAEIMPVDVLSQILPEPRFDERYFEELEALFESRQIAA